LAIHIVSCSRNSGVGGRGSGGGRGSLRPAADATWRPEMNYRRFRADSYALLFLLHFDTL